MNRRCSYISVGSCLMETKSDIISRAMGNPKNQSKETLSRINRDFLGSNITKLFVRRHHNELKRCAQFYSLTSLFNETASKDKHKSTKKNYFRCFFK